MLMKSIATGLVGSALLAGVAFAQSPTATTDRAAPAAAPATTTSTQGDWRASKMAGLKVYNNANENVGSIDDLLMDKSGSVKLVVIGVGGFLGMGEHLVAVPYDQVKFSNEAVASTTSSNTGTSTNRPPTTTTGAATATKTSSSAKKWYPDHAVYNATKDELKKMPEFKYSE